MRKADNLVDNSQKAPYILFEFNSKEKIMEIINDSTFENEVLKSDKPVLVDFFATWCGPCRQMLPIVTELSEEMSDKIKIVKMDVDESPKTPETFAIQSIPTLIIFKDGKVVDQKTGAMPKSALLEWINNKI